MTKTEVCHYHAYNYAFRLRNLQLDGAGYAADPNGEFYNRELVAAAAKAFQ